MWQRILLRLQGTSKRQWEVETPYRVKSKWRKMKRDVTTRWMQREAEKQTTAPTYQRQRNTMQARDRWSIWTPPVSRFWMWNPPCLVVRRSDLSWALSRAASFGLRRTTRGALQVATLSDRTSNESALKKSIKKRSNRKSGSAVWWRHLWGSFTRWKRISMHQGIASSLMSSKAAGKRSFASAAFPSFRSLPTINPTAPHSATVVFLHGLGDQGTRDSHLLS